MLKCGLDVTRQGSRALKVQDLRIIILDRFSF